MNIKEATQISALVENNKTVMFCVFRQRLEVRKADRSHRIPTGQQVHPFL